MFVEAQRASWQSTCLRTSSWL